MNLVLEINPRCGRGSKLITFLDFLLTSFMDGPVEEEEEGFGFEEI